MCRVLALLFVLPFLAGPHAGRGETAAAFPSRRAFGQSDTGRRFSPSCRDLFERVQRGLTSGDVSLFSRDFGSQVLINLHGGENGTYSAGQAHYVLESYCRLRRFGRFTFTTIDESGDNPYATGSVAFNYRGRREIAQVYVSLSAAGGRWVIVQINIY